MMDDLLVSKWREGNSNLNPALKSTENELEN